MRILVTGGAGYIGSHVVLTALDHGHDVTIFDNLSTSNIANINHKAKFVEGNINSNDDLFSLLKNNKFDCVIHLAGSKAAGESMASPKKYALNNIMGSLNILNKCIEFNIRTFIFSSSAAVYGKPKYIPIDEVHSLNPINYYGFSKLCFEQNLKWFSNSYGIKYASLRYFNAGGFDPKQRVAGVEENSQNLIPVVMEAALGKRTYVPIFGNSFSTKDGTGIRDYIHVSDISEAHINAMKFLFEKRRNLIVNLGSEKGFSVIDIINLTKEITGVDIKYKIHNPRKGDVHELVASCSLAKDLIGWSQPYSTLERIIKSTWSIYKNKV